MATILERNQRAKMPKKTMADYSEDALYREVWEDVNNEKTQQFLKKYSRHLIGAALVLLIAATSVQLIRHHNHVSARAAAHNYEMAVGNMDARALAAISKNSSGATADLALFQSWMLDGDASKLEQLASDGATRDFRDLARLHLATIKGDAMTPADFEKFLSPLNTKSSPFYYSASLMVAQKYLAAGDKDAANKWLDKIIGDKEAPDIVSANAQALR